MLSDIRRAPWSFRPSYNSDAASFVNTLLVAGSGALVIACAKSGTNPAIRIKADDQRRGSAHALGLETWGSRLGTRGHPVRGARLLHGRLASGSLAPTTARTLDRHLDTSCRGSTFFVRFCAPDREPDGGLRGIFADVGDH